MDFPEGDTNTVPMGNRNGSALPTFALGLESTRNGSVLRGEVPCFAA